jgi:hypothetical protein
MCQVRLLAADAAPEAGVRMLQLLADAPAGPRTAATVRGCRAHPRRVRTRFTVDPMRTAATKVAPPTPRRDRGIGDHPVQRRRPRAERPAASTSAALIATRRRRARPAVMSGVTLRPRGQTDTHPGQGGG